MHSQKLVNDLRFFHMKRSEPHSQLKTNATTGYQTKKYVGCIFAYIRHLFMLFETVYITSFAANTQSIQFFISLNIVPEDIKCLTEP